MMPVIRISDALYERLQKHAVPFVDTPATVIERWGDAYEKHHTRSDGDTETKKVTTNSILGTAHDPNALTTILLGMSDDASADAGTRFDCDSPPDLQHSRILLAAVDGEQVSKWNDLVTAAHRRALA